MKSSTQSDCLSVEEYMIFVQDLYLKYTDRFPDWTNIVPNAGYHHAILRRIEDWETANDWCKHICCDGDYSWAGTHFFFTHESDALLFTLCFGGKNVAV